MPNSMNNPNKAKTFNGSFNRIIVNSAKGRESGTAIMIEIG